MSDDIRERLAQITGRSQDGPERGGQSDEKPGRSAQERLREALDKDWEVSAEDSEKPSIRERLNDVLNKPREKLEIEAERDVEKDRQVENEREIDREIDRDPGLSH